MRRLIAALVLVVSLSATLGAVGIGDGQALAARALTADNCVEIALPIVPGTGTCTAPDGNQGISNDPATGGAIINYLRGWLQLLGGLVGVVIILMIVIAGVQYITSAADPGIVKSAKSRLNNAIIALVLYLSMYAILGFLIPGGIL